MRKDPDIKTLDREEVEEARRKVVANRGDES